MTKSFIQALFILQFLGTSMASGMIPPLSIVHKTDPQKVALKAKDRSILEREFPLHTDLIYQQDDEHFIPLEPMLSDEMKYLMSQNGNLCMGPNCFNAARFVAGRDYQTKMVDAYGIYFFLHSPLCRELAPHEPPVKGDIGYLFNGTKRTPLHTFTLVTPSISFTKNGFDKTFPYEIENTVQMVDYFKRFNPNMMAPIYYRCISLDQFFNRFHATAHHLLYDLHVTIKHAECGELIEFEKFLRELTKKKHTLGEDAEATQPIIRIIKERIASLDTPSLKTREGKYLDLIRNLKELLKSFE